MEPAASRSLVRSAFLLGVLVLAGALGRFYIFPDLFSGTEAENAAQTKAVIDPRRSYQGPFQNIDPDVRYVGMQACAACHDRIAEGYSHHPMARSLVPIAQLAGAQSYDIVHHNPFKAFDATFQVRRQGGRVWHRQSWSDAKGKAVLQNDLEVHYAIGSGIHGHSYLTVQEGGYVAQTPVSWFSQKKIWDASPGFRSGQVRPIEPDCLFCHANRALPREGYTNRYEPPVFSGHAIGCERCHGPGEKHLKDPGLREVAGLAADPLKPGLVWLDFTIVNPGKLEHRLAEAVCEQCHLEGKARIVRRGRDRYDFRPGLPLDDFWSTFVRAKTAEDHKAVNHVEQMHLSRCYQRSPDSTKLWCVSCHDPHVHVGPERRLDHYRQRCLRCHAAGDRPTASGKPACALPRAERRRQNHDDCAACHMPPYATSDIVHTASTDHRIVRRRAPAARFDDGAPDALSLVHFHRGKVRLDDKELLRDLTLALAPLAFRSEEAHAVADVVARIDRTLRDFPDDQDVWETKIKLLVIQERYTEALAAAKTVLNMNPQRETAVALAGMSAQAIGDWDLSLVYCRQAVALNPYQSLRCRLLVQALMKKRVWDEAIQQCREWLRLSPADVIARRNLIDCLLRTGKLSEARAEFAVLEILRPAELEEIRVWFTARLRESDVR